MASTSHNWPGLLRALADGTQTGTVRLRGTLRPSRDPAVILFRPSGLGAWESVPAGVVGRVTDLRHVVRSADGQEVPMVELTLVGRDTCRACLGSGRCACGGSGWRAKPGPAAAEPCDCSPPGTCRACGGSGTRAG